MWMFQCECYHTINRALKMEFRIFLDNSFTTIQIRVGYSNVGRNKSACTKLFFTPWRAILFECVLCCNFTKLHTFYVIIIHLGHYLVFQRWPTILPLKITYMYNNIVQIYWYSNWIAFMTKSNERTWLWHFIAKLVNSEKIFLILHKVKTWWTMPWHIDYIL